MMKKKAKIGIIVALVGLILIGLIVMMVLLLKQTGQLREQKLFSKAELVTFDGVDCEYELQVLSQSQTYDDQLAILITKEAQPRYGIYSMKTGRVKLPIGSYAVLAGHSTDRVLAAKEAEGNLKWGIIDPFTGETIVDFTFDEREFAKKSLRRTEVYFPVYSERKNVPKVLYTYEEVSDRNENKWYYLVEGKRLPFIWKEA